MKILKLAMARMPKSLPNRLVKLTGGQQPAALDALGHGLR